MNQKPMPKKYRSDALGALHESVQRLHRLGLVDTKTMREFDASCYLNVTAGLVSKWERGEKQPQGPSLKLLSLVQRKGLDAIA